MDAKKLILEACENGNLNDIRRAISIDRNCVNTARTSSGATALYVASQNGHSAVVEKLIAAGAKVDVQSEMHGSTALYQASWKGHSKVVKELIAAGAKVDVQEEDGFTALYIASAKGHSEVVKELIAAGAKVDVQNKHGWTALYVASEKGHSEVVKKLIAAGAKVDVQTNDDGYTALHIASWIGHSEVVKELIAAGAKVDVQSNNGWTALYVASKEGDSEVVKKLIAAGANVDVQNYGWTALHVASEKGHSKVVKELIAAGARVDVQNKYGNTALHIASDNGHSKVVKELIAAGANVDVQNKKWGATALHLASRNGHSAVVKRLIAAGAKVDVQEEGGATALHLASRNGHSAVVKELIAGTKCAEGTIVVEGLEEGARYEVETSRDEMITVNEADSPILVTLGKQLPFAEPPASSCAIFRRCRAALISKLAERPVLLDHLFEQADKCFCYGCHTDCPVYKRGSADYILPLGWARIGVKTSKSPALESMAFKEWHTCYHGTPPDHLYDILCCGQLLKPGSTTPKGGKISVREGHIQRGFKRTNAHNGKSEFFDPPSQVFFSPSIRYCDYGRVYMTEHHSAGHRYRFALQVRIQPGTYTVGQETVGAKRRGDIIDPYVPNTSIEWYTSELHTHMITGILVNER